MENTFFGYPGEDLSLNECLISSHRLTATSVKYIRIFRSITLKIHYKNDLQENHILLHPWIFDFMKLTYGVIIPVDNFLPNGNAQLLDSVDHHCIKLQLIQSQNNLPYDEFTSFDFFDQETAPSLPDNFSKTLPLLLNGYSFHNNGIIALKYLTFNLIFKCSWLENEVQTVSSGDNYIVIGKTKVSNNYSISLEFPQPITNQEASSPSLTQFSDSFTSHARNKIIQIVSTCCSDSSRWFGPHTILLSSASGSGKSTLLNEVQALIKHNYPETVSLLLSGNRLNSTFSSSSSSVDSMTEQSPSTTSPTSIETFLPLLSSFVHYLSPSTSQQTALETWINSYGKNESDFSKTPLLLLILDNIDPLLTTSSHSYTTSEIILISRRLVEVLGWMTLSSFSLPIVLIASTSIVESLIPAKFHGSPGFESIVTLPLPQLQDRVTILRTLFECVVKEYLVSYPHQTNPLIFQLLLEQEGHLDLPLSSLESTLFEMNFKEWISRAAALTAGYLPGDLVKIIRRMSTIAFGRLSSIDITQPPQESSLSHSIFWEDFLSALNMTPPHQLLHLQHELFQDGGISGGITVEGRSSLLSWNDFAGYEKEKYYIQNILNRFNSEKMPSDEWLGSEVGYPRGLLITGESGSGKSYLAKIIAAEARMNFLTIKSPAILSKYFGETEACLRKIFQKARSASPCVLFFDDFDSIAHNRGNFDLSKNGSIDNNQNSSEESVVSRILSTFLNELDGITSSTSSSSSSSSSSSLNHVFVIAACRDSNLLDKALLRPGRLSYQITLFPPDRHDIESLFRYSLFNIPLSSDICYDQLVTLYCNQEGLDEDHYNSSDVIAICREAIKLAVMDNIHIYSENSQQNDTHHQQIEPLHMSHFEKILGPRQRKMKINSEFTIDMTKPFTF